MENYAESEVFKAEEVRLWRQAVRFVEALPDEKFRCHELARAIGRLLNLEVQDGRYGFVEHTWLWTTPFEEKCRLPNVLDVYIPGALPQVQLIHTDRSFLPVNYRWDHPRDDIQQDVVDRLCQILGPVPATGPSGTI